MKKKPRAIDLFCGAGGLTEGLRQAGYKVVGAVEIDALACSAYKLNHKAVKLWKEDITRLSGVAMMEALKLKPGELDLLAACPPCQGFSTMRTKNGSRGNRDAQNNLIFDVLRLARSIKPKAVMLENVPGLAQSARYVKFRRALKRLGYLITSDILNTADFAVPQRRRRLVLLASKLGEPKFAPEVTKYRTVRQFIETLTPPERSRDPLHNYPVERSEKIEALIKKIPHDGGSRMALGKKQQLLCHQRLDGFWDVYGRMAWDSPSPTITGGCINPSKGRFLHPEANRAITLREAALLQTFPKGYKFPLDKGRYSAALLIGNALPPEFIKRHALALRAINSSPVK
ncbi:MAG: cytosine methyltransferase [Betaproteobacteria bacterium]|nr:cytosine methyltransferase [Betaproteobacteria bacterium]